MEIFYISGESNSRKTTAMLWALCAFAKERKDKIIDADIYELKPNYSKIETLNASLLIRKVEACLPKIDDAAPIDIACIIHFSGYCLGFLSEGDYVWHIRHFISMFNKDCDLAFMAVNDKHLDNFKRVCSANGIACNLVHHATQDHSQAWQQIGATVLTELQRNIVL